MELTLAAVLQEVLRIEKVGVDDNFFDLGASSLQLAQVHQRLQERLGREIPLVEVFNHSTVRTLAGHLEAGSALPPGPARSADRTDQLRQGRDRLRQRLQQKR
ncbi:MAG TPA: phosphopantetheine-binding protein [Thermoanaerobaculia bacterium]|nr:phosphopantetheine-binding protein [Thermoanaerobaculia bacterium]